VAGDYLLILFCLNIYAVWVEVVFIWFIYGLFMLFIWFLYGVEAKATESCD
jgi:hypothetical protein